MNRLHAGFELITIWSEKMVESSIEMAELENALPYEAEKWLISPSCAPKLYDFFTGIRITKIRMTSAYMGTAY